jgi:hypothetical protein
MQDTMSNPRKSGTSLYIGTGFLCFMLGFGVCNAACVRSSYDFDKEVIDYAEYTATNSASTVPDNIWACRVVARSLENCEKTGRCTESEIEYVESAFRRLQGADSSRLIRLVTKKK